MHRRLGTLYSVRNGTGVAAVGDPIVASNASGEREGDYG